MNFRNKSYKTQKAQGAIEYLLIIGAAILVVAVVVIALAGITSTGTNATNDTNVLDPLKQLLDKKLGIIDPCFDESLDIIPICTLSDLDKVKEFPNKNFILLNDIDASATNSWNTGKGFIPIGLGCMDDRCINNFNQQGYCENDFGCGSFWHAGESQCEEYNDYMICDESEYSCTEYCLGNWNALTGSCENPEIESTCGTSKEICQDFCGSTWYEKDTCFNYGQNSACTTKETCEKPYGCESTFFDKFTGNFDGNGKTISNIKINFETKPNVGFFSETNNSIIKNLTLNQINVMGLNKVGGLIGLNNNSNIENISVIGNVSSKNSGTYDGTGGLIGSNSGIILDSYSQTRVNGLQNIGGLVGYNTNNIINSKSKSIINGNNFIGGLVGSNEGGSAIIQNSFSESEINGINTIGGLIGKNMYGEIQNSGSNSIINGIDKLGGLVGNTFRTSNITNSYARGKITVTGNNVGGLVGIIEWVNNDNRSSITNSYSTTEINGENTNIFGFIGQRDSVISWNSVTNSFWDKETSKKEQGSNIMTGIIGKTSSEMKIINTFASAGWDFINVWTIDSSKNDGYPILKWQTT